MLRDKLRLTLPRKMTRHAARYTHFISCDQALLIFVRDHLNQEMLAAIFRKARIPGSQRDLYTQTLLQMLHSRAIDTFQTYFADAVDECMEANPELLSPDAQISYGELAHARDLRTLKREMRDKVKRKKLDSLSYGGFFEFKRWFKAQGLGLRLSRSEEDALAEWIATRNVIVHNHGLINERYLAAVGSSPYAIGNTRRLITAVVADMQQNLAQLIFRFDEQIARHFDLRMATPTRWRAQFPILPHPPEPRDWSN